MVLDHGSSPSLEQSGIATLSTSTTAVRVIVGAFTAGTTIDCTTAIDNVLVTTTP